MRHLIDRSVLKYWDDKEARLEAAHLLDQVNLVLSKEFQQVTPFLSFAMRDWIESVLRKEHLAYLAEGGFPDAERVRIIMGAKGDVMKPEQAEISLLSVRATNLRAKLEHHQILGSLMGLGLRRDLFGDIQVGQSGFYVATTLEIVPVLLNQWTEAGREKINVSLSEGIPDLLPGLGEERRITLNSSRLDAVIANAFGVSRSKAQEWITQGKVKKSGLGVSKVETEVQPNDIVSCRGHGRVKLLECSNTRKDKIAWQILLFRSQRH
ncbi:YlmH/Sll1252 family protein [Desulfosporosinus hippei]|uniref:RNA-binding protein YlmH, contains S4-like domain n=1 Tax=Desulfosporosinus hippei DSM 8344 TaxID=1121419 RepID=A0A1G7RTN8_9FIRM|nr:YlmH/Sll1252 family protein [Desulfosporosinus hippei]SDG13200.1 RNA-binding protein YlmH, contains S4-like domain [Desulfosporosinus hippei DSM 8344]